ncbi:transcription/translation regulatory transformer protein RfaH [Litorivicinus lipolyticus]|uniref:Transcription/translation regulatory transformer protein RfaH n=1 Tax=Litorivicinus lipolyticus TaxID=418701 RepID=A0A5Q2QE86_9GAMM|nr:transcription/translation regulatory transformer protein RfaH [Litorivicinus lipolyticus]QGG80642.1 transcription/translation regulatory transformer protein RfaH [Litorivicinus lipolyticus]
METASQPPKDPNPDRLTASQAAARMGMSTRQLQALRLRGIGPPIVQKGLDIHYSLSEIAHIEEHEVTVVISQVMQLPSPLTALKTLCDQFDLRQSPILKEVEGLQFQMEAGKPEESQLNRPVPQQTPAKQEEPQNAQSNPSRSKAWYLIHTKARQETTALTNLERQGYTCYLPKITIEAKGSGKRTKTEAMFPRYLFIHLETGESGNNWMPIRSTRGVDKLVQFGETYPRVEDQLIHSLRERERDTPIQPILKKGDGVQILDGPFQDLDAIFYTDDSEHRVIILINFLLRQLPVKVDRDKVRKRA